MDRLTQLQDAADDLLNQMIASLYYVFKHHDVPPLHEGDSVRPIKDESDFRWGELETYPANEFKAGQKELAQDLIMKEQQIEFLISSLPGLENSEKVQGATIKQLEEELKAAEVERKKAVLEKDEVQKRLDAVIRSVKRP